LSDRAIASSGVDIYGDDKTSKKQAVSLSFWLPGEDQTLYGVPEREDTLALKVTTGTDPYDMFAHNRLHFPGNPGPLYGSIPYVTSLSDSAATGLIWVNSARTTIDIGEEDGGMTVTYASEANTMEFFMLASTSQDRAKVLSNDLATVTGFAPMPLLHMLGFSFCKWYPISADMLMERNANFTTYGFPLDVLWSDIEWAD